MIGKMEAIWNRFCVYYTAAAWQVSAKPSYRIVSENDCIITVPILQSNTVVVVLFSVIVEFQKTMRCARLQNSPIKSILDICYSGLQTGKEPTVSPGRLNPFFSNGAAFW
jgi:hypothetical protein